MGLITFVMLCALLVRPGACGGACPPVCVCRTESVVCNISTAESVPDSLRHTHRRLTLTHLTLSTMRSRSFYGLSRVQRIEIAQSDSLRIIQHQAFYSLLALSEISIQNTKSLTHISPGAFYNLPKLRYLSISNTGIRQFPDMSFISSLESSFILEICDNLHLKSIPANAFMGISNEHTTMNLYKNGFREIHDYAFNGTKMDKLVLKNNQQLQIINTEAFTGATGPGVLDVSSTPLESLPSRGLEDLLVLVARGAYALKKLPPLRSLTSLTEAQLTYPSHCCSLMRWNSRSRDSSYFDLAGNGSVYCEDQAQQEFPEYAAAVSLLKLPPGFGSADFQYLDFGACLGGRSLRCSPEADAFNPCEDITGFAFLRVALWFMGLLAVCGNVTVLLVLLCGRARLSVPRFLMCHLAMADLCIGVYLLLIAAADLSTRGNYSQHAIEWQTGPGCAVAGFLSVLGGELSVYTLTCVTLERWHTITHALRRERRLGLRGCVLLMAVGWLLCVCVALLPLAGVSSYRKVSVCLPMDIQTGPAQAFVVLLLLLNVAAFLVVCGCYACIYRAVRQPGFAGRRADATLAQRMAVLIFTDFLCMAPISFFALSAALRAPLITVSHAKILLVLFYPINSCANPFLYAIFTKAFRRDALTLLSALGCCEAKASVHRMKAYGAEGKLSTVTQH